MKRHLMLASAAVAAALLAAPAMAQQAYAPPRTADGKPDLQGVWTNASLTSLERARNFTGPTIPAEQAAQMEKQRAQMMAAQNGRTNPQSGAPPKGQDVGGYNAFWIDPGSTYGKVNGEYRTSWIVDPPDGRIPIRRQAKPRTTSA